MNVIMSGDDARICGDDIQTYKKIPAGTYDICFAKGAGYWLRRREDLVPNEQKIYGDSLYKVEKVLKTFGAVNRNLGVILSGKKGCGKSMFVRILAQEAIAKYGLPVIVVSNRIDGVQAFISSIQQECLVIFDEFEKIFSHTEEEHDPQDALLPMFDGMDNGKKLFVITCNKVDLLNDCLLNRPGRFHYHFEITNPSPDEIRGYMQDNLNPEFHDSIELIVKISSFADVTYDFLRAIVFELNQGYSVQESMRDLNIACEDYENFDVEVMSSEDVSFRCYNMRLNFNASDRGKIYSTRLHCNMATEYDKRLELEIWFDLKDVVNKDGTLSIEPKLLKKAVLWNYGKRDDDWEPTETEFGADNLKSVIFKRSNFVSVNRYNV